MSSMYVDERSDASEPRRELRSDFTERTIHTAATARRRAAKWQRLRNLYKDVITMKSFKFLHTVPGVAAAAAVIVSGGVGAYALSNWFGGGVTVKQDNPSVFSVDLSSCGRPLPVGINIENGTDLHSVKFKITGDPHVSASELQRQLLGECEANAVASFYAKQFPEAAFTPDSLSTPFTGSSKYLLLTATIESINDDGTIALSSTGIKGSSFGTTDAQGNYSPVRTFKLDPQITVYSESKTAQLGDLKVGDNVAFVAYSTSAGGPLLENQSILDNSDVRVISIFRTQYDDGQVSFSYPGDNVMPLDMYNSIQNAQKRPGSITQNAEKPQQ